MRDIVLPDTTLCTIVRDEVMNPAGGIGRFLRSVLPHVEQAVIVDTGSVDGTREILEDATTTYPQLRVYDEAFQGYAEARNTSLRYASTPYVLVLDADEIILQGDYFALHKEILRSKRALGSINFPCLNIQCDVTRRSEGIHNPRFFLREGMRYSNTSNGIGEWLVEYPHNLINSRAPIHHFLPSPSGSLLKLNAWYSLPSSARVSQAPSAISSFRNWKEFNPQRNSYKASELDLPTLVPSETDRLVCASRPLIR